MSRTTKGTEMSIPVLDCTGDPEYLQETSRKMSVKAQHIVVLGAQEIKLLLIKALKDQYPELTPDQIELNMNTGTGQFRCEVNLGDRLLRV